MSKWLLGFVVFLSGCLGTPPPHNAMKKPVKEAPAKQEPAEKPLKKAESEAPLKSDRRQVW